MLSVGKFGRVGLWQFSVLFLQFFFKFKNISKWHFKILPIVHASTFCLFLSLHLTKPTSQRPPDMPCSQTEWVLWTCCSQQGSCSHRTIRNHKHLDGSGGREAAGRKGHWGGLREEGGKSPSLHGPGKEWSEFIEQGVAGPVSGFTFRAQVFEEWPLDQFVFGLILEHLGLYGPVLKESEPVYGGHHGVVEHSLCFANWVCFASCGFHCHSQCLLPAYLPGRPLIQLITSLRSFNKYLSWAPLSPYHARHYEAI